MTIRQAFETTLRQRVRSAASILIGTALVFGPGQSQAFGPVPIPDTWGGDLTSRPRLTGDWGGTRDELGKKGIVIDLDLLVTPQTVMSGGKDTGTVVWGNSTYTLNIDTGKAGWWPGGFFNVQGESGFGNAGYGEAGAVIPVNTATLVPEAFDSAGGLDSANFTQFLSPKFGLTAGKLFLLELLQGEFYGNYRTQFMNTALAFPMSLALLPFSAFGGGALYLPSPDLTFMALAVDPSGTVMSNDIGDAFDDGVMLIVGGFATIRPYGLLGHQNISVTWSDKTRLELDQDPSNIARLLLTERFPRLGDPGPVLYEILKNHFPGLLVPAQPAAREDSTWAFNYGFDQYLWQPSDDPKRGIGIFFNFGITDGKVNPVKYSYLMGIGGKGVVPGRPQDSFGFGWARTEFSDDFVPFLRQQLDLGLDHEDAVEIYYNAEITPWMSVSPSFQVVNSGMDKTLGENGNLVNLDTAAMFFLRTHIRF